MCFLSALVGPGQSGPGSLDGVQFESNSFYCDSPKSSYEALRHRMSITVVYIRKVTLIRLYDIINVISPSSYIRSKMVKMLFREPLA